MKLWVKTVIGDYIDASVKDLSRLKPGKLMIVSEYLHTNRIITCECVTITQHSY